MKISGAARITSSAFPLSDALRFRQRSHGTQDPFSSSSGLHRRISQPSQEIENLRLYLRTKKPADIKFVSEMMRRFIDKLEQEKEEGRV